MIILIIAFIAAGVIFWIFSIRRKHKSQNVAENNLLGAFNRLVFTNKAVIDYYEIIGNRIIALDKKNLKLIFIADYNGMQEICLCLQEISAVQIFIDENTDGTIVAISLVLHNSYNKSSYSINFYHAMQDSHITLPSLARKALRWKHKIGQYISIAFQINE